MAGLVARFPWLAHPILRTIAEEIVENILEELIQKTEFGAFYAYIDIRVNKQGRAMLDAAMAYQRVKATGSAEEKAHAEKELIRRFAALASWTS